MPDSIISSYNSLSGLKLERSPKCFRLLRVNSQLRLLFNLDFIQIDEANPDSNMWDKVKQEVLGGAFENCCGGLVTFSQRNNDKQDFICASSMVAQYSLTDESKMILVLKKKWSRAERDDIAIQKQFGMNELWMLPNLDKMMSLNEFEEFCNFSRNLNSDLETDSDLPLLKRVQWETICICNEDEIRWMNPSQKRANLVVGNLKRLCSEREIKFEEM